MEFIVYLGKQRYVTVVDHRLSKSYRFEKSIPTPVDNEKDKKILLNWSERKEGCGTCGNSFATRPMLSDVNYCKYSDLDLAEFRSKWTEYYEQAGH